jgi:hypothetical protein
VSIVKGNLNNIPGCILQANEDLYLVAEMEEGRFDYILLANGKVHSEPGGHRALYLRWALVHPEIKKNGAQAVLLEIDASDHTFSDSKAIKAPELVP